MSNKFSEFLTSSLRNRIIFTLVLLSIPMLAGLLVTYEVIQLDWLSFMEVQPAYRPMEAPRPVPADSIPVDGPIYIQGLGSPENPVEADDVSLQRGQILYALNCAVCHGPNGKGDGPMAAHLKEQPADLTDVGVQNSSDGTLFLVITNGVPGSMPALRENLTPRERWDVVNYVKSGNLTPPEVVSTALKGQRTPVPTLIPATMPPVDLAGAAGPAKCSIGALDLIGLWVEAGTPESDPFPFTDVNGASCQATFAEDVQPLFTESNMWYPGAVACSSCHNANLAAASANMDLSTYEGILAGSYRTDASAAGNDILGGGVWQDSTLFLKLSTGQMPLGRPANIPIDEHGPVILAGTQVETP
ncbi:MAG: cytochrome c [Anaerolineae bacterium]|nr:MAG: cytochrome c [Anaerolineae bacterium]